MHKIGAFKILARYNMAAKWMTDLNKKNSFYE